MTHTLTSEVQNIHCTQNISIDTKHQSCNQVQVVQTISILPNLTSVSILPAIPILKSKGVRYTGFKLTNHTCRLFSIITLLSHTHLLSLERQKIQKFYGSCIGEGCSTPISLNSIQCDGQYCQANLQEVNYCCDLIESYKDLIYDSTRLTNQEEKKMIRGFQALRLYMNFKYNHNIIEDYMSDVSNNNYISLIGKQSASNFNTLNKLLPNLYPINLSQFKILDQNNDFMQDGCNKINTVRNPMHLTLEKYLSSNPIKEKNDGILVAYNQAYDKPRELITEFEVNGSEYEAYWALGNYADKTHTYSIKFTKEGAILFLSPYVFYISKESYDLEAIKQIFGGINTVIYKHKNKLFNPKLCK